MRVVCPGGCGRQLDVQPDVPVLCNTVRRRRGKFGSHIRHNGQSCVEQPEEYDSTLGKEEFRCQFCKDWDELTKQAHKLKREIQAGEEQLLAEEEEEMLMNRFTKARESELEKKGKEPETLVLAPKKSHTKGKQPEASGSSSSKSHKKGKQPEASGSSSSKSHKKGKQPEASGSTMTREKLDLKIQRLQVLSARAENEFHRNLWEGMGA
jgi:hypothetical protein